MKHKHPGFIPKKPHQHKSMDFPPGFLWGAATSAHQVEGWNDNNDWWNWEHRAGTIADGQISGRGPDHYHHFREDFDLAEKMHHNSHRLSIEWSRINPQEGEFSEEAVEHYIEVLKDLKARGMKVMLTLHHFTNPIWFAKKGGFEKRNNIYYFTKYVEYIVPKLKAYVDFWVTINEPNVYTMMSYMLGIWPPGKTSNLLAYRVFDHLAITHRLAYEIIHELAGEDVQVGLAHNVTSFYAYNKHALSDWLSVRLADWGWNHYFLEKTKGYHDFLGLNYYVHKRANRIGLKYWATLMRDDAGEGRERTDLDWEIFAPGIFDALVDMSEHQLPIYITENGISTLNDHQRARYIISYLKEVYHAIHSGVDVRGYFHWSLLDNFEWDKGYKSRFGLIEVDFQTLERKIKGSGKIYGQICRDNKISHDLMRFIGHKVSPEDVLSGKTC